MYVSTTLLKQHYFSSCTVVLRKRVNFVVLANLDVNVESGLVRGPWPVEQKQGPETGLEEAAIPHMNRGW